MTTSNKCKCPWCGKWLLPSNCVKPYTRSYYRHCGREWHVDDRGMIYDPIDLRANPGYNPEHDSWEIDVTPKPKNNETTNS